VVGVLNTQKTYIDIASNELSTLDRIATKVKADAAAHSMKLEAMITARTECGVHFPRMKVALERCTHARETISRGLAHISKESLATALGGTQSDPLLKMTLSIHDAHQYVADIEHHLSALRDTEERLRDAAALDGYRSMHQDIIRSLMLLTDALEAFEKVFQAAYADTRTRGLREGAKEVSIPPDILQAYNLARESVHHAVASVPLTL
jgi:hypothetical protein